MKEIILSQGKFALVDDEDYERINSHKWCAVKRESGDFHAMRKDKNNRTVFMHHEILYMKKGAIVYHIDHKNRNGLDNRKDNLRKASHRINALNSARSDNAKLIEPHGNRFRVRPWINGQRTVIGSFGTLKEAQEAVRRYRETL